MQKMQGMGWLYITQMLRVQRKVKIEFRRTQYNPKIQEWNFGIARRFDDY